MSEEQFVEELVERTGGVDGSFIGDDCAILREHDPPQVVTVDGITRGVHFDDSFRGTQVGTKLAGINLSDIAAMGAQPRHAFLSLNTEQPSEYIKHFLDGVTSTLANFDVSLSGGDFCSTGNSSNETDTLTIIGEAQPEGVMLRSLAQPGDLIAVTGPLGGPASILEIEPEKRSQQERQLLWDIPVHIEDGKRLIQKGVRCGIDVSDGFLKDLGRICNSSDLKAEVDTGAIPIHPMAREKLPPQKALKRALAGGEDYCLLIAIPPEIKESLAEIELTFVGEFTSGSGISLEHGDVDPGPLDDGYDHFQD
ncbi:MAG: thiamine-phosphate kinase [bacterium]